VDARHKAGHDGKVLGMGKTSVSVPLLRLRH